MVALEHHEEHFDLPSRLSERDKSSGNGTSREKV